MDFSKSYGTDYEIFKERFKISGLGTIMDAKNLWSDLVGPNKYLKVQALKKLKNAGVYLRDLTTLEHLVKASIIILKESEHG